MSWGAIGGAVVGVVGSAMLSGGSSGGGSSQPTSQAAQIADPFAAQRPQYQSMLQQLMTNPASIQGSPGYQFQMDQGLQAVNRNEAAKGMLGSGNRLQELMQYGQGLASQDYNNQFLRLANLAGASAGQPGTAGSLQNAYNQQQAAGVGMLGQAVVGGLSSYMGNSNMGALPQYSTGTGYNPTGFDTGVGGSGYNVPAGDQASMLNAQWYGA